MIVTVRGRGIAANCCAHLLIRAGFGVRMQGTQRPAVPALLLSDAALALLRDVFDRPDLFVERPRITHRVVSWGGSEPLRLPHGAIVLSEDDLEESLGLAATAEAEAEADFTIHAAAPFPQGELHHFGSRRAHAARVRYRMPEDESACWMESVESGWMFAIPSAAHSGWLLCVGAEPAELLAQSRHLASRIERLDSSAASFRTHPRMLGTLQGTNWLACGTAAIGFDPICGDGTAQAVREAILAAAAITAMRDGEDAMSILMHYESMLIAAMRRHLKLCGDFYLSGGNSPWWQAQFSALKNGHDHCTQRLATVPEPRYLLQGFNLVPRRIAA